MKILTSFLLCVVALMTNANPAREAPERYWNLDELTAVPSVSPCTASESHYPGMRAWLVKGKGPDGAAADFFCYYAIPDAPKPAGGYPGVVLVHGGGGTAYPQFVDLWRKRGFAVIALDWYNQRPAPGLTNVAPTEVSVPRVALHGGKRQDHVANVANMVLAHSLLRSRPEVNPEKTVFVGLSWGSWYGAMVAAVDSRFKGVVEIYCGDHDISRKGKSGFVNGRFLHAAKVPVWWTVSTNDHNVTPDSSQAGYDECPTFDGCANVIDLPHSHVGFRFESVIRMALHYADGQIRLPKLGEATVSDGAVSAKILSRGRGIGRAALCYTVDADVMPTYKRVWKSVPAKIEGDVVSAAIPAGAFQLFLSVFEKNEGAYHELCGTTGFVTMPKDRDASSMPLRLDTAMAAACDRSLETWWMPPELPTNIKAADIAWHAIGFPCQNVR